MMKKMMMALAAALLLLALPAGAQQKMDKKNLIIKEWNTDVRTNQKYLDHVTTYNAQGKKIEEIEYTPTGQKWRKRYEIGENGKVAKEYVYDDRNVMVNYKVFEYNEMGKKTQTTYTPKGKVKTIKVYEYVISEEQ